MKTEQDVRDRIRVNVGDDGREDIHLGWLDATQKVMPNGEVRMRARFPESKGKVRISVTEGLEWARRTDIPWQDAHFHKGQIEVYTLVMGWVAFATMGLRDVNLDVLDVPSMTMPFFPLQAHNVLLGPGAVITTTLFGTPVGNPDRKMNDWWPAEEEFNQRTREIPMREIEIHLNK